MKEINFRSVLFGGYNKKDVIDSIEVLADQLSQSENELKNRTAQFLEEKQIFINKIAEYEKRISSLENALSENERKRNTDAESISMLQNDNHQLNEALKAKEEELKSARESIEKLNSEILSLKQLLEGKEKESESEKEVKKEPAEPERDFRDDTPTNIGNIILSVYSNCEKIIEEAKKEASAIISDAYSKLREAEREYNEYKHSVLNTKAQIAKYIEALEENNSKIDEFLRLTENWMSNTTESRENLTQKITDSLPDVKSVVEKYFSVSKFDNPD